MSFVDFYVMFIWGKIYSALIQELCVHVFVHYRQVSGYCDNNPCQPCNSQCFLRPQRWQRLVLRQWDASWSPGSWLQGYCKAAVWKHSQHRCKSKVLWVRSHSISIRALDDRRLYGFYCRCQYSEENLFFTLTSWECWNHLILSLNLNMKVAKHGLGDGDEYF